MPTQNHRIDDVTFNGVGRYVRIYGISRTNGYGYSLWDVNIYGDATETCGPACTGCGPCEQCANGECMLKSAGAVCRTAVGSCDIAETCSGLASTCPADVIGATVNTLEAEASSTTVTNCTKEATGGSTGHGGKVVDFQSGDTIAFPNVDLTGVDELKFYMGVVTAGGRFEVRLDNATTGTLLGTVTATPATGSWTAYSAMVLSVGDTWGTGTHNLYLRGIQNPTPANWIGTVDYVLLNDTQCNPTCGTCEQLVGSVCQPRAAGYACRPSTGGCDPAETCAGSGGNCPADIISPVGTTCRAAGGICDIAEVCNGVSGLCPTDEKVGAGSTCRSATGGCDAPEFCSGTSAVCPADALRPPGTSCRPSTGVCDTAETCSGASDLCPTDSLAASGTVCRAAVAGGCDVAETCSGASALCPADAVGSPGTVCRAVAGGCDVAETCTGSNSCPADVVVNAGTICRSATGSCDQAEICSGTAAACPADTFNSPGTVCRAAAGGCDLAETCDGSGGACPADVISTAGTTCRAEVAGGCDISETCNGVTTVCPADVVRASGTACRASAGVCDIAETCTGASNTCPTDAKVSAGNACRVAVGPCDVTETCNGTANACPNDAMVALGTPCRGAAGTCDIAETCNGTVGTCPADSLRPSGYTCRSAIAGGCDIAETCSGSVSSCPSDVFVAAGTTCPDEGGPSSSCTVDACNGSGTCSHTPTPGCVCANDVLTRSGAVVSSVQGANTAAGAIDSGANFLTTRWESAHGVDPQWIYFDLGAERFIGAVTLDWENASARTYLIQVASADSTTSTLSTEAPWTTIHTSATYTTNPNHRIDTITGLHGVGRYVRIKGLTRMTAYGYSLWNIAVFGDTNAGCGPACAPGCGDCQVCADGVCMTRGSGTVCRDEATSCDVAETCNGAATTCPVDVSGKTVTTLEAEATTGVTLNGCTAEQTGGSAGHGGKVINFSAGDSIGFAALNLTGVDQIRFSLGAQTAGGVIEARLDSATGALLGTLTVSTSTGSLLNYQMFTLNIGDTWGTGSHQLWLKAVSGPNPIANVDYVELNDTVCAPP
ncbi:MAG TPA: carbohydrate-binding protein, partial [Polyangiaceae bacterium]|nr:carbohydrate-binding protein [Polyangiaceae bacterium]